MSALGWRTAQSYIPPIRVCIALTDVAPLDQETNGFICVMVALFRVEARRHERLQVELQALECWGWRATSYRFWPLRGVPVDTGHLRGYCTLDVAKVWLCDQVHGEGLQTEEEARS